MPDEQPTASEPAATELGQFVYDDSGTELGKIQGFTEAGFEVSIHEHVSLEHEPGQAFGEGYLMWKCTNCGEMGKLDGMPEECPNCGAPKEDLYARIED